MRAHDSAARNGTATALRAVSLRELLRASPHRGSFTTRSAGRDMSPVRASGRCIDRSPRPRGGPSCPTDCISMTSGIAA